MSENDKYKKIKESVELWKGQGMRHLIDYDDLEDTNPKVFEDDRLVLTETFEEACEELEALAVSKYKEILELATKVFADLDQLNELMKESTDWKLSKYYSFYQQNSWMDRQNKIASLEPDDVSRNTIANIEESTEKFYPEIFNSKMQHLGKITSDIDQVGLDIAHLMAHLNAIINDPKKYLDISEDINKGEAPF